MNIPYVLSPGCTTPLYNGPSGTFLPVKEG